MSCADPYRTVFARSQTRRAFAWAPVFAFAALAGACGSDEPAGDVAPDTRTDTKSDAGDTSPDAPDLGGCMPLAPADLEALVFDGQDDVSTSYSLRLKVDLGLPAADYLVLQFINYNERIDNGAGTFPLDEAPNDNFGTCPECVALWVDQASPNLPPAKFLFQSSGTLRLAVDPRTRRLSGRLEGVRFAEIELDPMTLSSTFVPGGDCAVLTAPLDFDFRWVPSEWTCGAATYYGDDGCDCDCGAVDPDCYPRPDTPVAVASSDCEAGERCVLDRCTALCNVGIGDATPVGCAGSELCTLEIPDDVCRVETRVDGAALGEVCTNADALYCAIGAGNVPGGVCSYDEPRTCTALCASRADCGPLQHCYSVAGGWMDGEGKGFCKDGAPPAWLCDAAQWNDGATCHCGCGEGDPDCADPSLPVTGCAGGARCGADGACPE